MIFLVKSLVWQHRISMYFEGVTPFLGEVAFKWSYLGAQEELVGQTVVGTKYFGRVLYAEQVFSAIGYLWIGFRDRYLFFCIF